MLAVAIMMDPTGPQNEELNEWIALAQNLLQDMGAYNTLAHSAVQGLEVIRKRTQLILHPEHEATSQLGGTNSPNARDPPAHDRNIPATSPFALHYVERATQTLAQPQPSISDLLSQQVSADGMWGTISAGVFAGNFPGIEALCGDTNSQTLVNFLDDCIAR